MKRRFSALLVAACMISGALCAADAAAPNAKALLAGQKNTLKIGVVNFKRIVDESKYGKQEQGNFDALKKQMESVLEEKEKALNEITAKFNDADYVDSLSAEAENELKHKFRFLNQEMGQIQSQYYQTLNQANVKILQKLNEMVAEASKSLAKESQLDLLFNDDGCFYYAPELDVSSKVISILNAKYDAEVKNAATQTPA
ncbi:MAG: OmpH family outer membrane protein [Parachlamydiaceae bacterium]